MGSEFACNSLGRQNNYSEKYWLYPFLFKYWHGSDPAN
jgi:hypothetical protein